MKCMKVVYLHASAPGFASICLFIATLGEKNAKKKIASTYIETPPQKRIEQLQ